MPQTLPRRIKKLVRKTADFIYPPNYVLGRAACLGQEVFKLRVGPNDHTVLVNQQKVRCDLFLNWIATGKRPVPERIKPHMPRDDVYFFIVQQKLLRWTNRRRDIAYLFMDSFAELTDQCFVHKTQGWSFACHYSDLEHTPEFAAEFACVGLLPIAEFERTYITFFDWFAHRYPGKPAIFLHFPTTLDDRQLFKDRGAAIRDTIESLAKSRPWLQSISLPDDQVFPNLEHPFAYHFDKRTCQSFADAWTSVHALPRIR